ncbi:hypothetical protein MTR62_17000 [Novosphingobium sp. 1949]|uniref:Uncharacterized protein n=1 Tax=Novosphingobium organovorum TaxID=2930092 RepID=A0ABT0BH66_9SPHN|nr:hypothetical protein [Novosphingobium organovorum]MCJ2184374.1 hypothetical protein [Novosphingobium organovorum]
MEISYGSGTNKSAAPTSRDLASPLHGRNAHHEWFKVVFSQYGRWGEHSGKQDGINSRFSYAGWMTGKVKGHMGRAFMSIWRTFLYGNHWLASLLLAATLVLKFAVPTGYMVDHDKSGAIIMRICNGMTTTTLVRHLIPTKKDGKENPGKSGKTECPYASLAMASMANADPVLLALAFLLALGFAAVRFALSAHIAKLRPPLRGPRRPLRWFPTAAMKSVRAEPSSSNFW